MKRHILLHDGLTLYINDDGTYLEFTGDGKSGAFRLESLAVQSGAIVGEAVQAWVNAQRADESIDAKRFEQAPCYLCGYNGELYYQPSTHSCAKLYHAAKQVSP